MKKIKMITILLLSMSLFYVAPSVQVQAADAESCITSGNIKSWNGKMNDKSDKLRIEAAYGVTVTVTYPNGEKRSDTLKTPNLDNTCMAPNRLHGKKLLAGEKVKIEYKFKNKVLKTETITVKKGITLPKITKYSKNAVSGTGHPGSTVTVNWDNSHGPWSSTDVKVDASGKWSYQYKKVDGTPDELGNFGGVKVDLYSEYLKENELLENNETFFSHVQLIPGIVNPIAVNDKYISGTNVGAWIGGTHKITVIFPNGQKVEKSLSNADLEWSVEIPSGIVLKPQDKVKVEQKYSDTDSLSYNPVQPIEAVVGGSTKVPSVNYSAHVQNIGWQTPVKDGALAGTSGKSLRVESFRMKLSNLPMPGGIKYATHVQDIGRQPAVSDNEISGTTGKSLRMEAMEISLTGEIAKYYDVYYRTHIQNLGWLEWAKNGEWSGTSGKGLRMEAIEVKLVRKGYPVPLSPTSTNRYTETYWDFTDPTELYYSAHVQNIGWQSSVKDGAMAGTSGKGLRVESFKMSLSKYFVFGEIEYATHIQNIGWQKPVSNGEMSGTEGKGLRMEAIRVNLKGGIAKYYDVYYRTHVQNYGWLGWAKNGQNAGSEGKSLRMEALEVKLVVKGDPAPKTGASYVLANGQKV